MRALAGQRLFWITLLAAGSVVGLSGPFGTFDSLTLPGRMAYWLAVTVTTFWIGYVVSVATAIGLEHRGLGNVLSLGLGALLASLPVSAWLAGLHALVFEAPFWAEAVRLLPYVAVIVAVVAIVLEGLERRSITVTPAADVDPPSGPDWLDQLPDHLGRDLISLQAQGHYLQVETTRGTTLIRGTLQDAAEELDQLGLRLHRSWWVARNQVDAMRYYKGAPVLVLKNGQELPVGRTYRRSVRQALR